MQNSVRSILTLHPSLVLLQELELPYSDYGGQVASTSDDVSLIAANVSDFIVEIPFITKLTVCGQLVSIFCENSLPLLNFLHVAE